MSLTAAIASSRRNLIVSETIEFQEWLVSTSLDASTFLRRINLPLAENRQPPAAIS